MTNASKRKPAVTSMAAAMLKAVADCGKEGRSAGRVGGHIIKAVARGVGVKGNGHKTHKIAA